MTKDGFISKVKETGLDKDIQPYTIQLNEITDSPDVIGCGFEQGKWKVYQTVERGGHFVIKEFDDESEAYNYLYQVLLYQKKLNEQ
ncbi:MAG: hypothetical protein ACC608_00640 [Anaerofustis sp.]